MKKNLLIFFVTVALTITTCLSGVLAQDFPAKPNQSQEAPAVRQSGPNQPFYGYVPPPPIRHTWPGGYKVIFHELLDTLTEHVLGQY